MSKILVVAMALSFVLATGGLFIAQADCGLCGLNLNPCGWHLPSCLSCAHSDMDRSNPNSPYNDEGPNMGNGNPGFPWFRGK